MSKFAVGSYLSIINSLYIISVWSLGTKKLKCKFKTTLLACFISKEAKMLHDQIQNSPLCSNLQQVGREGKKEHRENHSFFLLFFHYKEAP